MHFQSSFSLFSSFVLNLSLITPVAYAFVWNDNNGVIFDPSCDVIVPSSTITKKGWIKAEWLGALDLAKDASERMQTTYADANVEPVESRISIIDGKDPAYAAVPIAILFMGYETQLAFRDHFSQVWRRMLESMDDPPGTGSRQAGEKGKINVICNDEEKVPDDPPDDYELPPCEEGAGDSAYTQFYDPADEEHCEKEQGSIIHICPLFFSLLPRHAVINKAKTFPNKEAFKAQAPTDPLYVDETLYDSLRVMERNFQMPGAQTLVHEWSHLPWFGTTNDRDQYERQNELDDEEDESEDEAEGRDESQNEDDRLASDLENNVLMEYYGWYRCAKLAIHDAGRPFEPSEPNSEMFARHLNNADSYAWYAAWGYYRKEGWLAWSG